MASTKCVGPAHPSEDDGEARRDLLGSRSSNTPSLDQLQAPDDAGESDLEFFNARPNVDSRIRLPFTDEFSDELLKPGAFVHVLLIRDPLTNAPRTRARAIFYSDIEGGSA
jgi:hypothetical protein